MKRKIELGKDNRNVVCYIGKRYVFEFVFECRYECADGSLF